MFICRKCTYKASLCIRCMFSIRFIVLPRSLKAYVLFCGFLKNDSLLSLSFIAPEVFFSMLQLMLSNKNGIDVFLTSICINLLVSICYNLLDVEVERFLWSVDLYPHVIKAHFISFRLIRLFSCHFVSSLSVT